MKIDKIYILLTWIIKIELTITQKIHQLIKLFTFHRFKSIFRMGGGFERINHEVSKQIRIPAKKQIFKND